MQTRHPSTIREEELKNRAAPASQGGGRGGEGAVATHEGALAAQIAPKVYEYGFLKR